MSKTIVWKPGDEKVFNSSVGISASGFIPPRPDYWCIKCGKSGFFTKEEKEFMYYSGYNTTNCPGCGGRIIKRLRLEIRE